MTGPEKDERHLSELMRRAQSGDAAAYVQLLEDITPRVRQFVRRQRFFLGVEGIEDLVQDILLSLHSVRATYDPGRPFVPWLMAIARNRLADSARRHARRAANEVATDRLPETFSGEHANMHADAYGDPEALRRAIRRLPRGQRVALEMLKLREMSLKEAATVTGMSVGALKVAAHRGMSALRKAMGGAG